MTPSGVRRLTIPAAVLALGAATATLVTWPSPATGVVVETPGYTLEISEVGGEQTNVAFDFPSQRPAVTVAHVGVSLGKAGYQAAATVEICGSGPVNLGRVTLRGTPSNSDFRVRYTRSSDGANITSAVVAGTYRTAALTGNNCFQYRVTVTRSSTAVPGDTRVFTLSGNPAAEGWATLKGATHVTAYRCIKLC